MRAPVPALRAPRIALRLPRRARRLAIIAAIAVVALTAVYYAWFRDSSLVRVSEVSVSGLTGPDAERVRKRLTEAGLGMTTLHVREDDLRRVVRSEPSIRAIHAQPDFPNGLRIDVTENLPVAAVDIAGSGRVPIAGNGTLMPGLQSKAPVPQLRIQGAAKVGRNGPSATRVTDERLAPLIRTAAAAPPALLYRAEAIERRPGEGIIVLMREGPRVMFGDDSRIAEKWRAAAGVLASRNSQGAAYVDVRMPERPVAGGLTPQLPGADATGSAGEPGAAPAPAGPSTPTGGLREPEAPAGAATPAPAPTQPVPGTP